MAFYEFNLISNRLFCISDLLFLLIDGVLSANSKLYFNQLEGLTVFRLGNKFISRCSNPNFLSTCFGV
jgi:hypothetical protein